MLTAFVQSRLSSILSDMQMATTSQTERRPQLASSSDSACRRFWIEFCMALLFVAEFTTNVLRHVGLGRRHCTAERNLENTVSIVTGANSGIGEQTVFELARRGSTVIMACRSVVAGERAKRRLMTRNGNMKLVVMCMDLSSFESINEFADSFAKHWTQLDVLINNAGVMACPKLTLSKDGHELQFAVNHLGHYLLTQRLLPLMTVSARIVNVSSVHHIRGRLVLDDINCAHRFYDPIDAYCASKLANVHFTSELARRLELDDRQITVYAVNPGTINTALTRHVQGWRATIFTIIGRLFNLDIDSGVQTTLHCVLERRAQLKSGAYYSNCRENGCLFDESTNRHMSAELWRLSTRLVKVDPASSQYTFI